MAFCESGVCWQVSRKGKLREHWFFLEKHYAVFISFVADTHDLHTVWEKVSVFCQVGNEPKWRASAIVWLVINSISNYVPHDKAFALGQFFWIHVRAVLSYTAGINMVSFQRLLNGNHRLHRNELYIIGFAIKCKRSSVLKIFLFTCIFAKSTWLFVCVVFLLSTCEMTKWEKIHWWKVLLYKYSLHYLLIDICGYT